MTDTTMCHAGSKDQHHWYAASGEALSTSWIFVLRPMRLAFRGDGKVIGWQMKWSVQSILSATSSSRDEVPRKLLKKRRGVLGVICGPLGSGFF